MNIQNWIISFFKGVQIKKTPCICFNQEDQAGGCGPPEPRTVPRHRLLLLLNSAAPGLGPSLLHLAGPMPGPAQHQDCQGQKHPRGVLQNWTVLQVTAERYIFMGDVSQEIYCSVGVL